MKIKHLAIVIFAISISFASCSSSNNDLENPVIDNLIPLIDFITGINTTIGSNPRTTISLTSIPISSSANLYELIKNYEVKTEISTINSVGKIIELNGSEDLYLGENKIQVIATNTSDKKVALDSITYNYIIKEVNGGIVPRDLVLEKNADGDFSYSITADPSDYGQILVEINNNFISNNKLGTIPKNLIKENESNNLKLTFTYGFTNQNKLFDNLGFRVKSEDLQL